MAVWYEYGSSLYDEDGNPREPIDTSRTIDLDEIAAAMDAEETERLSRNKTGEHCED